LTTQKVYEFAKEIGVETLTLMDKIRTWGLPIKSHMADLDSDLMAQIRVKLDEEEGSKAKSTKKKVTKKVSKKAAADGGDKPVKKTAVKKAKAAVEAPAKVAKKSTSKTVAAKASTKKAAEKEDADSAVAAKGSKTVIRRKKSDIEEAAEAALVEATQAEEVETAAAAAATEEVTTTTATPPSVPTTVTASDAAPTAPTPSEVAAAPASPAAGDAAAAPAPRKREVMMTEDGPLSGVKSTKRNIIGRMDLNRVSQLPQARQVKSAPRSNLRTGFVSQEAEPAPVVDFDDSKNRDKNKKKLVTPAPAAKDKEQAPPSFISHDFMKREIVFQPKKKKISEGFNRKTQITTPSAHKRVVKVFGQMGVSELAQAMGVKAPAVIKALISNGVMANINMVLDFETIALIAPEFKYEAQNSKKTDAELLEEGSYGTDEGLEPRAPVVTVMGHVDHGKTTLLDSIRKARVAAGEAGGITQHIGAYRVQTSLGEVTFIDTPGHEAFTAMRSRGAHATDIVILVVAADDGVMPQTAEAVSHAKAAGVPIIVAVNKMDKPGANPDRVKQQLAELELVPEDWGGSTQYVPVSALKGEGISELLDQISVQAEIQEYKANPKRSATGVVIESRVEKGRGNVATLLVKDGTLKIGQALVVGTMVTKVRNLNDENGKNLKEAGPSMPVEIIGLPSTANAGDRFDVCVDEKSAEAVAQARREELALSQQVAKSVNLEDLFAKLKAGDVKELPLILKTDVAGSIEAIKGLFDKISTAEVKLKLIHSAVGAINESDVLLASTAKGIVVGFNVRPDGGAQAAARAKGVEIKTYTIVYELVDDLKKALGGLLAPEIREKVLGRVQVRNTFTVPKIGTIAGCFVTDGVITRNSMARLLREGKVVYSGKITSLKRFKDDAREVATGFECGVGIENYNDIKVGDEIESYVEESIVREL
jgi:translation initiation factor IF-2